MKGRLIRSGYFLMGFLPAVIVALSLLMTQTGEAKPITYKSSTKTSTGTLVLGVGSSGFRTAGALPPGAPPPPGPGGGPAAPVASRPDTLFIMFARSPGEKEKMVLGKDFEGERMTVAVYKAYLNVGPTRMGDTKLAFVREIAYDTKLFGIDTETTQEVREIKKQWDAQIKKGLKDDED